MFDTLLTYYFQIKHQIDKELESGEYFLKKHEKKAKLSEEKLVCNLLIDLVS